MKRADVLHTITNLKGEEGHQKVLEVYNSQKPLPRGYKLQAKDPWCAATVTAVFLMNGYSDIAECSCPVMTQKAKEHGVWMENDAYVPTPGDVIMYDWQDSGSGDNQGNPDHVGIVVKVADNQITVREGNKNKSVGNRTISINGKYIRGFIVPPYESNSESITGEVDSLLNPTEKPQETAQKGSDRYIVGKVYTISVSSALNVRKGAGSNYGLVGYNNLTADGKKHAYYPSGALKPGTRVTVNEIKNNGNTTWLRIPSGWICAVNGKSVYVK